MDFVVQLIGQNSEDILTGKITKEQARDNTVKTVMQATQNSPGIDETWAYIITHVAYKKWVKDNIPMKYDWGIDSLVLYEQKSKNKTANDYMNWYSSRPDRPNK